MKTLSVIVLLTASLGAYAQQVVEENGKLVYKGHEFHVGQVIQLAYGSRQDKGFAFVFGVYAGHPSGNLYSFMGGYNCRIIKWKFYRGKYWIKAKPMGRRFNVFIDVMGAIDNKELVV
jgi:hypothetical protein